MKCRRWLRILPILGCFALAAALIGYPFLSNWLFEHETKSIAEQVVSEGADMPDEARQEELARAQEYNKALANGHVVLTDPFKELQNREDLPDYETLLNLSGDGSMGTVEIPKIEVNLPIYHGTAEEVLRKGAGHLVGSSLPVGGPGTHSVITGHTGLSSARLFSDLTELEEGDVFFLHVLGETLAYQIDNISVVLPSDLSELSIIPKEDHCTLVTCTPYGINSHRLLVRGTRTELKEAQEIAVHTDPVSSTWMEEYKHALAIGFLLLGAGLTCYGVIQFIRYQSNKERKE